MNRRIQLAITLLLLLMAVSLTVLSVVHQMSLVREGLHARGPVLAKSLALGLVLGVYAEDATIIEPLAAGAFADPDVVRVTVFKGERVLYDAGPGPAFTGVAEVKAPDGTPCFAFAEPIVGQALTDVLEEPSHRGPAEAIGRVAVVLSGAAIERTFRDAVFRSAALGAILLLLGVPVGLFVARRIAAPVEELTKRVEAMAAGELDQSIPVVRRDEVGVLAGTFNRLSQSLRTTLAEKDAYARSLEATRAELQEERKHLEEKVRERTDELERLNLGLLDLTGAIEEKRELLQRAYAELAVQNERIREADRLKSEFLANMSHELRTPLNAVIGFSELLTDEVPGKLNEDQQQCVQDILTSGRHLLRLINDVLDLSKIEAGKMELSLEVMSLMPLLEEVERTISPLATRHGHRLAIRVDKGVDIVEADRGRLKQVLLNLVSNAIKFTPDGGEIRVVARPAAGGTAIDVIDTGVGIAPEDIPRLFQQFEQLDASSTKAQEGTGLGLSLAKRLVEMHGGTLTVESAPGKGSTFTVTLPREAVRPAAAPAAPVAAAGLHEVTAAGRSVLVVEDDPRAVDLLTRTLTASGYQVSWIPSGVAAVPVAAALAPSAIILDILLPGGRNGWQVLRELRSSPETEGIPVIIVSVEADQRLAFSLGAAGAFVKPVDPRKLLRLLSDLEKGSAAGLPSILVIDDDETTAMVLRKALTDEGYRVKIVGDGLAGLEAMRQERPDMVILDLVMPRLSGIDVAARMREDPVLASIPVVILTGKELDPVERARIDGQVRRLLVKESQAMDLLLRELASLAPPARPAGVT